ncbi:hypothetical protein KKD80_02005 [Patescibacteria group bacterium]|nr:hypothetical protein [Patescibacteria group bacterium]
MTLGELVTRENLVGRVFRAHEKNGFAYRGIVARAGVWDETVVLRLSNHSRRFEDKRRGIWKHLPDTEISYEKNLLAMKPVDDVIAFTLADGSEVYLYPAGTRLENVENAPLF